jgi:Cdc6-like AAA superfamily ATPase
MNQPLNYEEMKQITTKVYSPTTPIKEESLFFGRKKNLDRVHQAVIEDGQHIILYGERGVGKTSLSNIVASRYRMAITPKVTCNSSSTLHSVWKSIFQQLPLSFERRKKIGFKTEDINDQEILSVTKMSDLLSNQQNSSIDEITNLLLKLSNFRAPILFIFDEFDQVRKNDFIHGMSNIVKYCSDHIANITIMLVGIGNSVNDLIGEHQSIERCVKQIYLERMSDPELLEILNYANTKIGVTMDSDISKNIVRYSAGFPHYTHLLGKFSTLSALERSSNSVKNQDFTNAIKHALENASESIRNTYQKAIITTKKNSYFPQILIACALAPTDQHGTFRASDLESVLKDKLKLNLKMQAYQYHIGRLCIKERGEILEKIEISSTQYRYRFCNPLFKGFLLLKHFEMNSGNI